MKFGQLIDYNTRTIFLEKSFSKWGGETIPRPPSKESKLSISPDEQSKVSEFVLMYAKWRAIKLIQNEAVEEHLLLPHIKLF